jgi:hypothetical protein
MFRASLNAAFASLIRPSVRSRSPRLLMRMRQGTGDHDVVGVARRQLREDQLGFDIAAQRGGEILGLGLRVTEVDQRLGNVHPGLAGGILGGHGPRQRHGLAIADDGGGDIAQAPPAAPSICREYWRAVPGAGSRAPARGAA